MAKNVACNFWFQFTPTHYAEPRAVNTGVRADTPLIGQSDLAAAILHHQPPHGGWCVCGGGGQIPETDISSRSVRLFLSSAAFPSDGEVIDWERYELADPQRHRY